MSDKFVNGLKLTSPAANQCGRTFSRWLVEWLVEIVGFTVVQAVAGNWRNYVAQGTAGKVVDDYNQFSIADESGYSFTTSDVGGYITITGFSGRWVRRNGIYRILKLVSNKVVILDVKHSIHEDGMPTQVAGLTWKLWRPTTSYVPDSTNVIVLAGTATGYSYHLHINVRSTNSYFPELRMSPFASWVSGSGWSDSRYTSVVGIDNWNNSLYNVDSVRIWAAADLDRFVISMRVEDDYYAWHFIYGGEIDVPSTVVDPKPCILWTGSNRGNSTVGDDNNTMFGYGSDSNVNSGGRWLAQDNLTTVTGYATFAHSSPSSDVHWTSDTQRMWGESTRERLRQAIVCECRTSSVMEMRGTLRRVWFTGRDMPRLRLTGINGEYMHTVGGILIPWNNSKVWYERG